MVDGNIARLVPIQFSFRMKTLASTTMRILNIHGKLLCNPLRGPSGVVFEEST